VRAAKSLRDLGFVSAIDLLSTYAGHGPDLAAWLKDAAINTDRDLRLQYLAGIGLNVDAQHQIHSELMKARRIPPNLFVGSAESLANLRNAIESNEPGRRSARSSTFIPNRADSTLPVLEHPTSTD
jgi:spermidine synthase